MREEILRMEHICCTDEGVLELDYLNMQIFKGEIYGILELENYGISKLIALICRNTHLENGQVFFDEKRVNSARESDGSKNKATVIGRQSRLIDSLSLADNLFVLREGFHRYVIPERAVRVEAERVLKEVGIGLSARTRAGKLSRYHRLVLEVMKAVIAGSKLIILWDISDMLSAEELPQFHRLLRKMTEKGNTFLYIYGHHEVLRQVCDRIAVFKEQKIQKVLSDQDMLRDQIVNVYARYAYNKLLRLSRDTQNEICGKDVIRLEQVCYGHIRDLSFSVSAGENVLLLDRSNTIIDELSELLVGEEEPGSGIILPVLPGKERKKRIVLIKRDAVHSTLFPELSYLENLCSPLAEKVPLFWQKSKFKKSVCHEYREKIGPVIEADNLYGLSQKDLLTLVYYRYLIARPELVICVQPLSNMDMHLRSHVLELMAELRNSGIAVLMLNTELYDTFYIANKLVQVEHGTITKEYTKAHFDEARRIQEDIFPD